MSGKKWLKMWFLINIIAFSLVFLFNIYVDSYSILKSDYRGVYREPNQNYIKMKYLLSKKRDYNSFIFGSSRVGKIDPRVFTNGHYYNMTYSEGVPREHLANIKLLLKRGYKIKNIVIGLDDFSYQIDPDMHMQQLTRKPHYKADYVTYNKFTFFLSYYLKLPTLFDIKRALFPHKYKRYDYDIYGTGMPIVPKSVDDYIENHRDKYIHDPKFSKPASYRGERIEQTLKEIKEIINLCKTNDINLTFFINPIHHITYLDTDFDEMQKFKLELSKITPYYDFSGLNRITTDNYYFYETSHYRIIVGNMIVNRLMGKGDKDFGIWIDQNNIQEHLKDLKEERVKYIHSHS